MTLRYLPSNNRLYVAEMTLTIEDLTAIAKVIASLDKDDLIVEFGIMPGLDMIQEDNDNELDFDIDFDLHSEFDRYTWDELIDYYSIGQDEIKDKEIDNLYDDMPDSNKTKGLKIKKDAKKSNR